MLAFIVQLLYIYLGAIAIYPSSVNVGLFYYIVTS